MSRAGQSRRGSAIEAISNIIIGIGIAFVANAVFLPLVGVEISPSQNVKVTALFTALSFVRSYTLCRVFNSLRSTFFA